MTSLTNYAKRLLAEDDGPTTTEYAVMLALIVVVCIGAISSIGTKVETTFTNLDAKLPTG